MGDFDKSMVNRFDIIKKELVEQGMEQSKVMQVSIKSLEKYIEQVHGQQIDDYEKLKKIATDAALGINSEALGKEA